jgi:hypothetical protein
MDGGRDKKLFRGRCGADRGIFTPKLAAAESRATRIHMCIEYIVRFNALI